MRSVSKVIGHNLRSQKENVKVVGVTLSEGFLDCVPKSASPLACCNFDTRQLILIIFDRNDTEKLLLLPVYGHYTGQPTLAATPS